LFFFVGLLFAMFSWSQFPLLSISFFCRVKWNPLFSQQPAIEAPPACAMYENSCSYQTALDLKRVSPPTLAQVKTEDCLTLGQCSPDWTSYRFHQSTFEQLKQSVEKAKAALQDRSSFFGCALPSATRRGRHNSGTLRFRFVGHTSSIFPGRGPKANLSWSTDSKNKQWSRTEL